MSESGVNGALGDVSDGADKTSEGAGTVEDDAKKAEKTIGDTVDSVTKGAAAAESGLKSANEAYKKLTGHDSGVLTGLGGAVQSVDDSVIKPVAKFATEVKEDIGDIENVAGAVKDLGSDVSTTAKDGQSTVTDTGAAGHALSNLGHNFSLANVLAAKDAVVKVVGDVKKLVDDGKKDVEDAKKVVRSAREAYTNIVDRHSDHADEDKDEDDDGTDSDADPHAAFTLHFHTSVYDDPDIELDVGDLAILQSHGHETLSQIYEFEITLAMTKASKLDFDTIDAMLSGTAYIGFGPDEEYKIHGVLKSIESIAEEEKVAGQYRAVFVPRLWYLSQTFESTVYQHKNAVDILIDILKHHGMGKEGEDFEVRIPEWKDKQNQFYKKYPKREYTVQFQETELNFVSRLLEHEGIFFFFEHGDDKEKLVIADANTAFQEEDDYDTLKYSSTGGSNVREEHVTKMLRRKTMVPRKLHVRDYNYRTPSVNVTANAPVDDDMGQGEQFLYGEHFKSLGEGKRFARVRAEEIRIQREQFHGASMVRGMRPGMKFTLDHHPNSEMDGDYIVTSVSHSVEQSPESDGGGDAADAPKAKANPYGNEFTAIAYDDDVPYRPARITPKPRIVGVMHARIDQLPEAGDTVVAPIDEQGRYKVILPFDNEDAGVGKASRWIRLAEPYTGVQHGMHFPLHVGTEVLLVHIDGDPDRPVIMASVPNMETGSVVTNEDATRSRIVTRSNIRMVWRDRTKSGGAE